MAETTVKYKGVHVLVTFDYEAAEKAGRESPPSPEFVEITSVTSDEDISEIIGSDALEAIAKLVILNKKEAHGG